MTEVLILKWTRAQFRQTGNWPTLYSGPVLGQLGENWNDVDRAQRLGIRGLAGGSSLARLLSKAGLKPNRKDLPARNLEEILSWLEADHQATGKWPTRFCGPVRAASAESWSAIDSCLRHG